METRASCGQTFSTYHGARVCRRNIECQHHLNLESGVISREMAVIRASVLRIMSYLTSAVRHWLTN